MNKLMPFLAIAISGCVSTKRFNAVVAENGYMRSSVKELQYQVLSERRNSERYQGNIKAMEETVRQAMEIIEENKKRGVSE